MAVRPGDSHHRANWTPLPHQSQSHLGPDRSARYFTGGLVKSRHRLVGRSPLKTNRSSLFPPAGHTRPTGHPFSVRPSVRPLPQCDKSTDRWRRTNWSRLSAGPGARGQLAALLVRPVPTGDRPPYGPLRECPPSLLGTGTGGQLVAAVHVHRPVRLPFRRRPTVPSTNWS